MKTIDISGYGGGYEATCQAMLFAGIDWLKKHPDFTFDGYGFYEGIFGYVKVPNTPEAKELEAVLNDAVNSEGTGAMHQAVIEHLIDVKDLGYEGWLERYEKGGREIIEVTAEGIEREIQKAHEEWQARLAAGYDPAKVFKDIPMVEVDFSDPESIEQAAELLADYLGGDD